MAAWRHREPTRIEPPAWYREFDPAMWDAPDEQERRMLAGCGETLGEEWVAGRHRMHAERRWVRRSTATGRRIHSWPARSLTTWSMVSGRRGGRNAARTTRCSTTACSLSA
jgi:hypothetical protein